MNILLELQPALADLTERFGGRIEAVHVARPNEVYFHVQMELVPGFCAQLYKKWNARLVSLFADDARSLPNGVRPSPGAAASARSDAPERPQSSFAVDLAAPEDGRTPAACNCASGAAHDPSS